MPPPTNPTYIKPAQIPDASPAQLEPILLRLLECPRQLLPDLANDCATAIADLPDEDRPRSYEGLCDVARFCVEDEPGWDTPKRALFIGGHPRIGAPITANTAELSEESRKEQLKGGQVDPATLERLARLNALYEARYPGLRFVTYVAGRSRAAVADELAANLGAGIADLAAPSDLPADQVRPQGTHEWQSELDRASDALWEIATDRAGKLTNEVESQPPAGPDADGGPAQQGEKTTTTTAAAAEAAAAADATTKTSASEAPPSGSALGTSTAARSDAVVGQDVPFLSLAAFRMLVLSSPVLESFFESDLTPSFYLEPVQRSQSGGAYAWHTAPTLPGAPRAVPGAAAPAAATAATGATKDAGGWAAAEASYSRDVTSGARGKVVGFLGGLLGEEGKAKMTALADQVGQRLQTHTVSGPKPSFGRKETLDGGKMDTQELRDKEAEERRRVQEERKGSLGSRLANALRGPQRMGAADPSSTLASASSSSASASASPGGGGGADERGRTIDRRPSGGAPSTTTTTAEERQRKRMSLRGTDLATSGPLAAAETLRAAQAALVEERPAFVIDEVGANGEEEEEEDEEEGEEGEGGAEEAVGVSPEDEGEAQGLLRGKEAAMAKELRQAAPQ
ncbi:uncharacterized protein PFL1_02436 [Pseudozyma flocculosa PF-1]|uniref:Oxo-4-hydroxy-4-carboxy-5-ureidoimidazoline decarboxylase domain-containing protein n=2 Tax=Pseudozyma flocculosa TaxID=84751 RepID=A0A5C3F0S4_9BASI|nr:uncharacterized protein PFL1_02436 [Pseudozyma flocculosa PF-1]EPQ29763.1 hypothetical protein PFL1_02436 [Pseudozyma flocculosa PF-1]SPO37049.1 uncharacterized protein PSFLO_02521 [Pseudozyma flocculosa]